MATIKDTAICVRHWDFSETSQTVGLFAREHGMIRGLAKGSKREKGEFSGGIDVLSRGEVVAILKPGRDLATLTRWSLEEIFPAVRTNLAANRAAIYMADLVYHMLTEGDPHPELFDAFVSALRELERPDQIDLTMLHFQWRMLRETGYQPQLDHDAMTQQPLPEHGETVAFSSAAGGVVTDKGERGRWRVRRDTIDLLRAIEQGIRHWSFGNRQSGEAPNESPNAECRLPIAESHSPNAVNRANRLLAAHFRELIGSEPSSMRWAFSDLPPREQMR
jgi:DNA repair protein RecO (recombination protein O)